MAVAVETRICEICKNGFAAMLPGHDVFNLEWAWVESFGKKAVFTALGGPSPGSLGLELVDLLASHGPSFHGESGEPSIAGSPGGRPL
jgi:hypothetical protein